MSNQVSRNSRSNYFVQDNHQFLDDSLTRWNNSSERLENSLAIINDAGDLSVPTITTDEISVNGTIDADILCALIEVQTDLINEKTLDNGIVIDGVLIKDNDVEADEVRTDMILEKTVDAGVTLENKMNIRQQGNDLEIKLGNSISPNPTQDIHYQMVSKRDIDFHMMADVDGVAVNDDPNFWMWRDANTRMMKTCICGSSNDAKIVVGGDGTNPNLQIITGANYTAPTDPGSGLISSPAISNDDPTMTLDSNKNVYIPNGGLDIGSDAASTIISPTLVNIRGTNASQTAGPHVSYYTDSDDRPLLQVLPYTHDNINISFDAYLNLGGGWTSSHTQSYQIYKSSSVFCVRRATTGGAGSLIAWEPTLEIGATTTTLRNDDLDIIDGGLTVNNGTGKLDYIQNKSTVSFTLAASTGSWATVGAIDFYYTRIGNVITLGGAIGTNAAITTGAFLTSGTTRIYPVGYRPTVDMYFPINTRNNTAYTWGMLHITINGEVRIYSGPNLDPFTTTAGYRAFSITFDV